MDNMKTMMRGNHDKADADELHQQLQGLHVDVGDDPLLWALYRQFNTERALGNIRQIFSILKLVVEQLVVVEGQCLLLCQP